MLRKHEVDVHTPSGHTLSMYLYTLSSRECVCRSDKLNVYTWCKRTAVVRAFTFFLVSYSTYLLRNVASVVRSGGYDLCSLHVKGSV